VVENASIETTRSETLGEPNVSLAAVAGHTLREKYCHARHRSNKVHVTVLLPSVLSYGWSKGVFLLLKAKFQRSSSGKCRLALEREFFCHLELAIVSDQWDNPSVIKYKHK